MKKKTLLLLLVLAVLKVEAQSSTFAVSDSLFAIGRYKMALKVLDEQPKSFENHLKKATIYESIDAYKKAMLNYEKALTFKDDYKTKLKLAKNYRAVKQYKKAIKIYEGIVAEDSLNLVLQYQLGKLYIITKNKDKALTTFQKLEIKDPENANYSYHLGLSYALHGQRDPMMNSFLRTYEKDSMHLRAISRLAKSYLKLNDPDSIEIFVDKGLKIAPNDIDLNRMKINHLYGYKQYAAALPYLLHIDTLPQKDTYSKVMLGRTYYELDSLEKAKKYLKLATRLDREDYKSYTYLGHISLKEEEHRAAMINYMSSIYAGQEKRDEEYYGLATVLWKMNNVPSAIRNFQKAYEQNGRNHRALYQQAKLSDDYYKDKKIAYNLYQKYIEKFWETDEVMTTFVRKRIKEIKNDYFQKGEVLR